MSQKEKNKTPPELDDQLEEAAAKEAAEEPAEAEAGATDPLMDELEALKDQAARQEEKYLRLAAEYDNFRKRTAKEKEAIWNDAKRGCISKSTGIAVNIQKGQVCKIPELQQEVS